MIAQTPKPPYYAVIFTSLKTGAEEKEYSQTAEEMHRLAAEQPGFLGVESARNETGITVSYWSSLEAIKNWKENSLHKIARRKGKEKWYAAYKTRICLVERDYEFSLP